jgi:hypothetical protein
MPKRPKEKHKTGRIGWLRAAVLGANDGILSTASIVLGVAWAHRRNIPGNGAEAACLCDLTAVPSGFGRAGHGADRRVRRTIRHSRLKNNPHSQFANRECRMRYGGSLKTYT